MANLVKRINYDCPQCDQYHEVEVYVQDTKSLIEGTIVEHEETYYYCPNEDEEFTPAKVMNQNLLAARDAYRVNIGRLPSSKIRDIREMFGLTQKEFANLLGWGDVTVQRYESKTIQDETYDQKMRLIYENPQMALKELEKHEEKFDYERYLEIKEKITDLIKKKSLKYHKEQIVYASYVDYNEPSDSNGGTRLNLDKIKDVIHYLAHFSSRLYKVKLMKLLWYSDALAYKRYGNSITGLVYKHLPLGAVPIAHEDILDISRDAINIHEEYFDDYIAYRIESKTPVNLSYLSEEELDVLNEVIRKFDTVGSRKISDYMHEEEAYIYTKDNQIIPYSLAGKIKEF
ncbi:putative zinc finger/helix-turn-helix YgiT family protein [Neobacillus sp. B4I6]|uniref:type II TA system antitoxin MqsA family protein n=1 Tax=Neobacillus sp. B4I6 TaxID=3373925 RepID=UPI003D1C62DE